VKCVLNRKKAVYLSIPITSVEKILNTMLIKKILSELNKYINSFGFNVRDNKLKNLDNIYDKIADTIFSNTNEVIINPKLLNIPSWEQEDYHFFWGEVIKSHIYKIIFFPGWEFSNGCNYEFAIATKHGIKTSDLNGKSFTILYGIRLIKKALKEMNKEGLSTSFIEKNLEYLKGILKNNNYEY
ncbi:MAG: hypothetical protein J7L26_09120, partial [Candidatus Aminicenantes bacterium]|nr:hypothetical protein [Candidatus Aminicenantes bacterium]